MSKVTIRKRVRKIRHRIDDRIKKAKKLQRRAFPLQGELIAEQEPVIFDIGAHVGETAQDYRDLFPNASIYCFEPFPKSFQVLSNSLEGDSRIYCNELAVSNKKGIAALNANLSPATNSLLSTDERGASFWGEGVLDTTEQVQVNTTTIDAFCLEEDISHIDILKMDVQGAEYSVFEGAREVLARQNISLIYTELIMCPTYEGQHKLHEYLSFLDSFGYEFLDFFNCVRRNNQLIQADVVFLSPGLKKEVQSRPVST